MRFKILGIGIAIVIGLAACKENIDVFVPFETNLSSLSDGDINRLFDDLKVSATPFTWEAEMPANWQSPGGTTIDIPADAFVNSDGQVINGPVTLNLVEMLSAGQMIIHDKPNVASGNILEAAGNFQLVVEQEGNLLQLAPNKFLEFQLPVDIANPAMQLFWGDNQDPAFFEWQPVVSGSEVQITEWVDPANEENHQAYQFVTDHLGWIGCNAYIEENQQWTTVCVDLPKGFDATNTVVYLAFQNFQSVAKLYTDEGAENPSFCKDLVPRSSDAVVVVLAEGGEEVYYFATSSIHVVGTELKVALQPERVAFETIKTFLSEL